MTLQPTEFQGLTPIPPLDIKRLFAVLWYGKTALTLAMGISLMAGGYYAFYLTQPSYAATATLRVDPSATDLRDVSEHWSGPATDPASLNTELAILTSDRVLGQVVQSEGLLQDPEFNRHLKTPSPYSPNAIRASMREWISGQGQQTPDQAAIFQKTIENLRAAIRANQPGETYLFQLSATSRDADKAARLANAVATTYITAQVTNRNEAAQADIAWLHSRVAELRMQLQAQEDTVTALRAGAQLQDATELNALSFAVLTTDQETATLAAQLAAFPDSQDADPRARSEQAKLQAQLSEVMAEGARLSSQLAEQSAGLALFEQAQRDAQATQILYEAFLGRLQETQVQQGLDAPNARLLAPATTGQFAGPRKILILQMSLLLGLMAGVTFITLRHLTRKGVLHEGMLAQVIGQPVAATFSKNAMHSDLQNQLDVLKTEVLLSTNQDPFLIMVAQTGHEKDNCSIGSALATSLASSSAKSLLISERGTVNSDTVTTLGFPQDNAQTKTELNRMIAEWRTEFQYVFIDAGPIRHDPTRLLWARKADVVVLCTRWHKTPLIAVKNTLESIIRATDAPVLAALTHVNPRKQRRFARMYGPAIAP